MAGQKHKKKSAAVEAAKSSGVNVGGVSGNTGSQALFCELCNVSCSGRDVMVTHLNGARHKKVAVYCTLTVFALCISS